MAGITRGLNLSMLTEEEQNITSLLSSVWSVNFAKKQTFKSTTYSFIFVRGNQRIREEFHLTREILVLFINGFFLPKSLDFVDKAMEEYHNRLDKLCVIIIAKDNELLSKIHNIVQQDQESRIMIPYTYDDILNNPSKVYELQIEKLKNSFYERDLFSYETPLKTDSYFYGREDIVQELYGKYKTGQCAALFGLRRIGKTSSLYAVLRKLQKRTEPYVYIDCSETSFHKRRWNEALYFIIQELHKTTMNGKKCGITTDENLYTEKDASKLFENDLKQISNAMSKERILIVLDEIENITFDISPTVHWKDDLDFIFFWQVIRSIFQKKPDLFSFIISGVNPKAIETSVIMSQHDNPIYRFMSPAYLPLFDSRDVKKMVTSIGSYMGMEFDQEVFTYLTDDFGGHPFIIRQICSQLFKMQKSKRPIKITKFIYEKNRVELTKSIYDYLDLILHILKEKYEMEYELLQYLAFEDFETFQSFAEISTQVIAHLIGYGLIIQENNTYFFKIKSLKPYLIEHSKINIIPKNKEEKWSKISALRNTLESDLRKLVKMQLKLTYGISDAKERFLSVLSNKQKYKDMPYNDIFTSHLYFEDIRKIIEKEWDIFGKIFNRDKGIFSRHMELINKYRIDAHANEIDEATMGLVLSSLQWVHDYCKDYID